MSSDQSTAQFSSHRPPIPCSRRPALSMKILCVRRLFPWNLLLQVCIITGLRGLLISPANWFFPLVNEHLAPIYLPALLVSFLARISGSANVPPYRSVQNRPVFIATSIIALTAPESGLHAGASPTIYFPAGSFLLYYLPSKKAYCLIGSCSSPHRLVPFPPSATTCNPAGASIMSDATGPRASNVTLHQRCVMVIW